MATEQTFRSPAAVVVWWVWLLFAAANLGDLAVQGRDHLSLIAAATLVFVTGVAYVAAQRPRVIAGTEALTIRNPLRDHVIPWASVIRADLADLLQVRCLTAPGGKARVISAWAVHYSRRRQYAALVKPRRAVAGSRFAGGAGGWRTASEAGPASEAEAEKAVAAINDRVKAAHQPGGEAPGGGGADGGAPDGGGSVRSTWNGRAIAALAVPALVLAVCCLV